MTHKGFCIASYNMRGWNQRDLMICDFMISCDFLFQQETWLSSHNVSCLDVINEVKYIAVCDKANHYVSCGRPRGGIALLWNRKFNKSVDYIGSIEGVIVQCLLLYYVNCFLFCYLIFTGLIIITQMIRQQIFY